MYMNCECVCVFKCWCLQCTCQKRESDKLHNMWNNIPNFCNSMILLYFFLVKRILFYVAFFYAQTCFYAILFNCCFFLFLSLNFNLDSAGIQSRLIAINNFIFYFGRINFSQIFSVCIIGFEIWNLFCTWDFF